MVHDQVDSSCGAVDLCSSACAHLDQVDNLLDELQSIIDFGNDDVTGVIRLMVLEGLDGDEYDPDPTGKMPEHHSRPQIRASIIRRRQQ